MTYQLIYCSHNVYLLLQIKSTQALQFLKSRDKYYELMNRYEILESISNAIDIYIIINRSSSAFIILTRYAVSQS